MQDLHSQRLQIAQTREYPSRQRCQITGSETPVREGCMRHSQAEQQTKQQLAQSQHGKEWLKQKQSGPGAAMTRCTIDDACNSH